MKKIIILIALIASIGISFAQETKSSPFDKAIRPITSPTLFDLALPRTSANLIYINQGLPSSIDTTLGPVPLGGGFNVFALQLEYALNERTSIIATKDG